LSPSRFSEMAADSFDDLDFGIANSPKKKREQRKKKERRKKKQVHNPDRVKKIESGRSVLRPLDMPKRRRRRRLRTQAERVYGKKETDVGPFTVDTFETVPARLADRTLQRMETLSVAAVRQAYKRRKEVEDRERKIEVAKQKKRMREIIELREKMRDEEEAKLLEASRIVAQAERLREEEKKEETEVEQEKVEAPDACIDHIEYARVWSDQLYVMELQNDLRKLLRAGKKVRLRAHLCDHGSQHRDCMTALQSLASACLIYSGDGFMPEPQLDLATQTYYMDMHPKEQPPSDAASPWAYGLSFQSVSLPSIDSNRTYR